MTTKAKSRRNTLTAEERKERESTLKTAQKDALRNLISSDEWSRYLRAGRLLRSYSLTNTLLILAQCPDATNVAGFSVWKALGRRITSGRGSGLKIWGKPYRPTLWVEAADVDNRTEVLDWDGSKVKIRAPWTRCPILTVFDISQTDGEPLPEVATALTASSPTDRDRARVITRAVTDWLRADGWTVERRNLGALSLSGGPNGATMHSARTVVLDESLSEAQSAKTLLHEAAHAILHSDDAWAPISQYGKSEHRGIAEIQAESTAYMVAGMLGLNTSDYSTGYVAVWAKRAAQSTDVDAIAETVEQSAEAVRFAMNRIMDAIEGPASEAADAREARSMVAA